MVKIESARIKAGVEAGEHGQGGVREIYVLESLKNRPHLGINVHPSKKCRYPGHKF
jgi:hypothetical protein